MNPTVLIVDDDLEIRATLRMLFEDADYPVVEAKDGEAALDELRSYPQRLVVLIDRMMPRLDGMGLLRVVLDDPQLQKRHAYLYMTARHDPPPPEDAQLLATHRIPVVTKPYHLDALLLVVSEAAQWLAQTNA